MQHLQKTRGSHPSSQKRFSFSCPAHPFKPHLPSSVHSSKFRIPQPLCLPLLRKLPGCVPTIPILERAIRDAKKCRVESKVFQRGREGKGRGTAESIVSGISRKGESRLGGAVCGCRSIDRSRSVRAEGSSSGCDVESAG